MGKIRISTLGTAGEEAQKTKAKVRREEKKKRLVHLANLKGGQKIVDMGTAEEAPTEETAEIKEDVKQKQAKTKKARERSKKYQDAKKLLDKGKIYSLPEAIDLLKKTSLTRFDGTVELHLNTFEKGLRGQLNLPHGTGKKMRIAIADETLLAEIEKGKVNFDILVATPEMMPKLAKVAKILGPKGLMPNPKAGTISDKPEELARKLSRGQMQFKTESDAPIIHLVLGKVSFSEKDLEENFKAVVSAIGPEKIKNVFLKSTMSPAIKVKFD